MVRSLFGNSNRKLRSTFWGSPFIPVGTNQTECCLPLTNFSVPSRFQTHATQIRPFLDSNRNGCGISTVNWQIAYHYAFATPTGFFCQMVSTPGFHHSREKNINGITPFFFKNNLSPGLKRHLEVAMNVFCGWLIITPFQISFNFFKTAALSLFWKFLPLSWSRIFLFWTQLWIVCLGTAIKNTQKQFNVSKRWHR